MMSNTRYPCPCCSFLTCSEEPGSGSYNICPVCRWEDDPVQFRRPELSGGANIVSLNEARENFKKIGASDVRKLPRVRPPNPEEKPH